MNSSHKSIDHLLRKINTPQFQNPQHQKSLRQKLLQIAEKELSKQPEKSGWLFRSKEKQRAKYYLMASASAVLLIALLVLLTLPMQISLAEVIVTTLESPFHAVWVDQENRQTDPPTREIYSSYPRMVEYANGKAVSFNDGDRTWTLDHEPPIVRHENADVYLAARTLFIHGVILESIPESQKGWEEVERMPDTTFNDRAARVWRRLYRTPSRSWPPHGITEYIADSATNRLLQVTNYSQDFGDSDSDGDRDELIFFNRIRIQYNEIIPESVFDIELPSADEALVLSKAQNQFDSSEEILLWDETDFQVNLKHCLIGPKGEILVCIVTRSKTGERPPYISTLVVDANDEYYHFTSVRKSNPLERDSSRYLWYCFTPGILQTYLDQAGKQDELADQQYTVKCREKVRNIRREFKFHPQGTFSEKDFHEKVTRVLLSTGKDKAWYSYDDLQAEIAFMSAHRWAFRTRSDHTSLEQYVKWVLYYKDLTQKNGQPEKFTDFINDTILKRMKGDKPFAKTYQQIERVSHIILNASHNGETLTAEEVMVKAGIEPSSDQEMSTMDMIQSVIPISQNNQGIDATTTMERVLKVKQDIQNLAVALELYYIANYRYPTNLNQLTTPVTYIKTIPTDPFGPENDNHLQYKSDPIQKWILQSRGPDGDFDLDPGIYLDPSIHTRSDFHSPSEFIYDQSKGAESSGDIVRVGP